jgi:hypothetical protein
MAIRNKKNKLEKELENLARAGINNNREAGFSGVITNRIDYINKELSNILVLRKNKLIENIEVLY